MVVINFIRLPRETETIQLRRPFKGGGNYLFFPLEDGGGLPLRRGREREQSHAHSPLCLVVVTPFPLGGGGHRLLAEKGRENHPNPPSL